MGCYGIGVSRILGALAQKASGEFERRFGGGMEGKNKKSGFVWNPSVAPFTAVIVVADLKDGARLRAAEDVYQRLINAARVNDCSVRGMLNSIVAHNAEYGRLEATQEVEGVGWTADEAKEVVIDDRSGVTMGSKLADSDLMGYSFRLIVGKHFAKEGKIELQYATNSGWGSLLLHVESFGSL